MKRNILLVLCMVCLMLFSPGAVLGQAAQSARIGVFDALSVPPDTLVEVPVRVENVQDLYAIDIELTFDPAVLSAQDADPNTPGIQVGFGTFLDPGLLLYNTVDNEQGVVRFVMSQANPSEPKSGDGVLFVIYFKGLQEGESALQITNLQISDRYGMEIPSEKVEASLSVRDDAPATNATAIPVVNPNEMIALATPMDTPIPAVGPTATPAPQATETAGLSAAAATTAAERSVPTVAPTLQRSDQPAAQGSFLLDNWWLVLVVAGIVVGLGIYIKRTG